MTPAQKRATFHLPVTATQANVLWLFREMALDTRSIANLLEVPEHQVERDLHLAKAVWRAAIAARAGLP